MDQSDKYSSTIRELSKKIDEIDQRIKELISHRQAGFQVPEHTEPEIGKLINEAQEKLKNLNDMNNYYSENPSRFNISDEELTSGKNFAIQVNQRLNNNINVLNTKTIPTQAPPDRNQRPNNHIQSYYDRKMEQQERLLQDGDKLEDEALDVAVNIKLKAKEIGDNPEDDEKRRDDINNQMDHVEDDLDKLIKNTKDLLNKKSTWMWVGCIILTIIVLILFIWSFVF